MTSYATSPQNFLWITFRASRNLDSYPTGTNHLTTGIPRRARCVKVSCELEQKLRETGGVWEFGDTQDPASWPGLRDA